MVRFLILILSITYCASSVPQEVTLPDFGSRGDSVINKTEEAQIGKSVITQLRGSGAIMEDALVTEYINTLGSQLVGHASNGGQDFEFFMIDDETINAFALPGGFIGVHVGLILASETESELAGVLAHEIAHVTQRHLARRAYDNQRSGMLSMAATIATMIIGLTTDVRGNAIGGLVTATQGAAIQRQINFTRANEHEADRIGIRTLSSAGFDPSGMGTFFEKLSRRYGTGGPAILRTHPVTTERIAEARDRARLLPSKVVSSSTEYQIMKTRLEVLQAPRADVAFDSLRTRIQINNENVGDRYGFALSLSELGLDDDAQREFGNLVFEFPGVIAFRIGEAESLVKNNQIDIALDKYANAIELFPRNVPLTNSYANALITSGHAKEAHRILLDLLNNSTPTPEQFRLIARAADADGDMGNAHHYMSHYYASIGNYPDALTQIQLALEAPDVNIIDRARFESELETYQISTTE
ncbi:MAG: hypothetical protein CMM56_02640 [Rhodospirillaceae bacterium]|nr:hypothetical protein [Rhodospirillaceae bacterium]